MSWFMDVTTLPSRKWCCSIGESPLLVVPFGLRNQGDARRNCLLFHKRCSCDTFSFIKNMLAFILGSIPLSYTNYFSFYSEKVQSWLYAKKDVSVFPRSFLLQNWQKKQRNANEQLYTEMSPKVSDLLSWNQSKKKSFAEGEGYSWQPRADSMVWTVNAQL